MPDRRASRRAFLARIAMRRLASRCHLSAFRGRGSTPCSPQARLYDTMFRSDREAVTYHYATHNDHLPDLDAPTWINEKIRWQFLHHPNPLMSLCADKIAVRDYLAHVGARIAPPALVAVGDAPEALGEVALPHAPLVLKSSYGSNQHLVLDGTAPIDRLALSDAAARWTLCDRWRRTGELHYRPIPKRWLVEEWIPARREPLEFKFFCFHGEPRFLIAVAGRCADGFARVTRDLDWRPVDFQTLGHPQAAVTIDRPPAFDLMVEEARRLSAPFLHVRVDFLQIDGQLYFSELTFAPMAARLPLVPVEKNRVLGDWIDLSAAPDCLARGEAIAAALGAPLAGRAAATSRPVVADPASPLPMPATAFGAWQPGSTPA